MCIGIVELYKKKKSIFLKNNIKTINIILVKVLKKKKLFWSLISEQEEVSKQNMYYFYTK